MGKWGLPLATLGMQSTTSERQRHVKCRGTLMHNPCFSLLIANTHPLDNTSAQKYACCISQAWLAWRQCRGVPEHKTSILFDARHIQRALEAEEVRS